MDQATLITEVVPLQLSYSNSSVLVPGGSVEVSPHNCILLSIILELDAVAVPRDERDINTIYFPDLEGDREREFGNAPAQAKLPARLLIERGAKGKRQ